MSDDAVRVLPGTSNTAGTRQGQMRDQQMIDEGQAKAALMAGKTGTTR